MYGPIIDTGTKKTVFFQFSRNSEMNASDLLKYLKKFETTIIDVCNRFKSKKRFAVNLWFTGSLVLKNEGYKA